MTPRLILARHGNTFAPQDTPVWVGARSDLPLVEKGLAQAQALAESLLRANILPDRIIAGPLRRTRQAAEIVAEQLALPPDRLRIDPRLREIDYGAWEGKSTEEIIALGAGAELTAWDKQSLFPASPGWQPTEAQIAADIAALLDEMARTIHGTALIVTSNGILRFFARHAANQGDFPSRKVGTGNICVMDRMTSDWRITAWNQPPDWLPRTRDLRELPL